MSPVICHLSPTPTATVTDHPPANSLTMHSKLYFNVLEALLKRFLNIEQQETKPISGHLYAERLPLHLTGWPLV